MNLKRIISVAAILLVVISAVALITNSASVIVEAGHGEFVSVNLPDGSEVTMNDGSNLKYAKNFNINRRIDLIGEALFKVNKGTTFTVHTGNGKVEVLGTVFNVRAWSDHITVSCYEGSVRVESKGITEILKEGREVKILSDGIVSRSELTNNEPSWTNGESVFRNTKISDVFAEVERQFDVKVHSDSDQVFNGKFSHEDLKLALGQICIPLNLAFEINADNVIIKNKD